MLDSLPVPEFTARFRPEMIPLDNRFAYFSAVPLGEEEVREFLQDPIAALPPALAGVLSNVMVFLVPYLERAGDKSPGVVTFKRPGQKSQEFAAHILAGPDAFLVLAIRDRDVADYHYDFYRGIATVAAERQPPDEMERYVRQLKDELRASVHGEVDEEGWKLKMLLIRKQSDVRRDSKLFRVYARQSFIDTMTLYLHGLCCDIDVDTGPRQLPTRHLRRRLELLRELFPPPSGYAVFPEELKE